MRERGCEEREGIIGGKILEAGWEVFAGMRGRGEFVGDKVKGVGE